MKIDESISILKQYIDYDNPDIPDFYTMEEACKVVINALEQQVTDAVDRVTIKEYLDSFGKDTNVTATSELSSIRHELLERKDELVSFGQLIERFDDVDAEYGGSPWTLKQIYANFNILIGIESVESPSHNGVKIDQEPCDDCISRSEALSVFRPRGITEDVWKECDVYKKLTALPPVTPQPKPNIKALGEDMRICQKSITDKKVLIGFNMAVALCNKHLAESEVQDADSD